MSLVILSEKASIDVALATMNPIALDAAKSLATRLVEDPTIYPDKERLNTEACNAIGIACIRTGGFDPNQNMERFNAFLDQHLHSVMNLGVSMALFVAKENERKRKWGWVKKAAGVGIGIAIGSLFG
jgi:hypothetical protein